MSDVAQGPGWWKAADGKWYPPEHNPNYQAMQLQQEAERQAKARKTMYSPQSGARAAMGVFKLVSFLILIFGLIGALAWAVEAPQNTTLSTGQIVAIAIGIAVGVIIYATIVAFFAYVLDLLIQIEGNTRETGYNVRTGKIPAPPHHG